jgi:hypothetical protein
MQKIFKIIWHSKPIRWLVGLIVLVAFALALALGTYICFYTYIDNDPVMPANTAQ